MGRFTAHSTRLPGTAQIRAKADHYKRRVLSNLQMARSTKAFFSSVLGSPLGNRASESSTRSWFFASWGNVPGSPVSLGRSRGPFPLPFLPQLPFSRFGLCPSPPGASPACGSPPQRPPGSSEFPLWVGRLSCDPLPPTFITYVSLLGRTTPGSSLHHPFPAEPGAQGEPGEQTQQIAERWSAAPLPSCAASRPARACCPDPRPPCSASRPAGH